MTAGSSPRPRVAVIGAGMAGLSCARALADAGMAVVVFEKSRGVGGRMATRRLSGAGAPTGEAWQAEADHGAPSFSAHRPAFAEAVRDAVARGWLLPWQPSVAAQGNPLEPVEPQWVGKPNMKSWCAALARCLDVRLEQHIDELSRVPGGWAVHAPGGPVGEGFDQVVLALPPAQAAVLLRPHQRAWAERLEGWPMQATWTWLGVSAGLNPAVDWQVLWPLTGPLARLDRQSGRSGREAPPGHEVWTAHATIAWTDAHLEAPAAQVEQALREAVEQALGHAPRWAGSWVHRWRYAQAAAHPAEAGGPACWWAPELGLGVCGDALGSCVRGTGAVDVGGVEAAWMSGRALAARLLHRLPPVHGVDDPDDDFELTERPRDVP